MTQATSEGKEDATFLFARNAVSLNYGNLTSDVIDITKKGILDTIGVSLAATGTMPEIKVLVDMMREVGGKKESTILAFGDRMPAWHAGYVNGAMAHCLDYDDMHPSASHIHAPVVPATLAMAERLGGVSGKELITAVALGVDLECRLLIVGKGSVRGKEWYIQPIAGVFASAIACGKLLMLDEDRMVNALGIAFTQAGGTMEIVYALNSNIRGIVYAIPGEVGVRAALMAQRGITGVRNCFEGGVGLINTYFGGEYDRSVLIGDLGERFPARDDGFKPWPSCAQTHSYIDITLELLKKHDIRPEKIEEITVTVGDIANKLCEPREVRIRPSTSMNAKWSIPFAVAVAVVRRKVGIGDFVGEALNDPAVLEMAQRVSNRFNPDYNQKPNVVMPPGEVEIKTKDGQTYSLRQEYTFGHPKKPMSWEDLVAKFRDCAAYSAKPLSQQNINKAIEMLANLEEVDNAGSIVELLANRAANG